MAAARTRARLYGTTNDEPANFQSGDDGRGVGQGAGVPRQARTATPLLVVTKANTRSTVHRDGYTDYVGVKRLDAEGRVIGEHRFIGLFTSTAYSSRVAETPLLRGKVERVAQRAGLTPGGHLAKALQHTLETYPRDDLFQIPDLQAHRARVLGLYLDLDHPTAAVEGVLQAVGDELVQDQA